MSTVKVGQLLMEHSLAIGPPSPQHGSVTIALERMRRLAGRSLQHRVL